MPVLIRHDGTWSHDELQRFALGEMIDRAGKRYALCPKCRKIVCLTKRFIGGIHICEPGG